MKLRSILFPLFAFLICSVANAQEMQGTYRSTNLDGSPLLAGHTVYIEAYHSGTDLNGIESYTTWAYVVNDLTGQIVHVANPGSLQWDPDNRVGQLVGSIGTAGWLFDPVPGSGTFVADYSNNPGGNIRAWTKL